MRFEDAVTLIDQAARFDALVAGHRSESDAYRKLVKLVHPDAVSAPRKVAATNAFARLSRLYAERGSLSGDIADLFRQGDRLLKIPRSPRDNDMMTAEAEALRKLRADGDPRFRPYAPELLDSFTHEDAGRRRRVVNVLERLDGFVPLSEVHDLDPRDAAWMWRRLLVALGWAHRAGVVHGAVFEEHVLIHPAEHGVVLVDWCLAAARGARRAPAFPLRAAHFPALHPLGGSNGKRTLVHRRLHRGGELPRRERRERLRVQRFRCA
nr:hypothetical protein [uncultured Actinoplanes sp.]